MMKIINNIMHFVLIIFMFVIFLPELISENRIEFKSEFISEIPVNNPCSESEPESEDSKEELEDFCIRNTADCNSCMLNEITGDLYKYEYRFILLEILTPPPELSFV
jgi:hypothetical protein